MIENISCVIIAKDAQNSIKKTLDSLVKFKDVVLYLNNSTDNTDKIASKYSNVNIVYGEFLGFGRTKNKASLYAKNSWILSLDADEVLSSDLITQLENLKLQDNEVYSFLRVNFYKDIQIKHCWGDDILVRLYNKNITAFKDVNLHESILTKDLKIVNLDNIILHYPYSNISEFIIKADRYSTIFAQENRDKKSSSPSKAIFNAIFSFCKTYFLKRGFLDGYAGLIIAFSHATTNFYKYIKLYEINLQKNNN
jgi:hypothetical protein